MIKQTVSTEMIFTCRIRFAATGTEGRDDWRKQLLTVIAKLRQATASELAVTGEAADRKKQIFYRFRKRHLGTHWKKTAGTIKKKIARADCWLLHGDFEVFVQFFQKFFCG
jgi:hypothetical protein